MPVLPSIINTLQGFADVEGREASTQESILRSMQMKKNMEMQDEMRKGFKEDAAPPPPGTGNAADPSGDFSTPAAQADPMAAQFKSIQSRQAQYDQLAKRYRQGGYFELADKYDALAKGEDTNLRQMSEKIFDKNNEKVREAWQTMQGVHDQPSLDGALRYLIANTPSVADKILKQVPFTNDGVPIYNDKTKALIDNAANQFKTMHEQASEARSAKSETDRESDRQRTHEDRVAARNAADKRAANTLGLGERRLLDQQKRTAAMEGHRDEREVRLTERDAQADLNKSEFVKNFDKYQQGYMAAKNVNDILKNPDHYPDIRSVSVPAVTTMMQSYPQMVQNYRSLMGSKVSAQQNEQLQGMLQRVSAYLSNVGRGKVVDAGVVREVNAEMGRMYQDMNAAVAKRTLELRARVAKKGGDPNAVVSPATLSDAIRSQRADMLSDPKDGQKYARFGPNKEDIVPIYDAPIKKRGASVPDDDEEEE